MQRCLRTWLPHRSAHSLARRPIPNSIYSAHQLPPTFLAPILAGFTLQYRTNSQLSPGYTPWWNTLQARKKAQATNTQDPAKPEDLILFLLRLVDSHPRLTFQEIANRHDYFPNLQSNDSFNILLDLATKSPLPRNFAATLKAMQSRGFGDNLTLRLYVRHLARTNRAKEALSFTKSQVDPLVMQDLLMELMQIPVTYPRQYAGAEEKLPHPPSSFLSKVDPELLKNSISSASTNVPFLRACVDYLLYTRRPNDALSLLRHSIAMLPSDLDPQTLSVIVNLVNRLLQAPPATISRRPLTSLSFMHDVLALFGTTSSLRPTPTTVAYALEWYRAHRYPGQEAYQKLKKWKAKWGDVIEDTRVRRKIASFALSNNNGSLCRKMINREYAARTLYLKTHEGNAEGAWPWMGPRDNELWQAILTRYEGLSPKRGWTYAERGIWDGHLPDEESYTEMEEADP